jgi:peptidoglycan-associated lipoprotein
VIIAIAQLASIFSLTHHGQGTVFTMKFKALGAFAGLALLAACSSTPTTTANTGGGNNITGGTNVPGSEGDLVANVGDRVFFDLNKSTLSSDADSTYPSVDVLVAGNADERGSETYNLALGNRRAHDARDYLVAQGVAASRIQTISYGKDCPVAAGNDDAAYQQNRNAITSVQGNNPQNCH